MDVGSVIGAIPSSVTSLLGAAVLSQIGGLIRIDHPMTHEFAVEIDGIIDAGFTSAEGLSDRATPYEVQSVTDASPNPIYPYRRQIGRVTLKKGITYQGLLEKWYYDCQGFTIGNKSPLKNVDFIQLQRLPSSIPFLGGQLIEVRRWSYPLCVCRDLTSPKFDANRDEIAINEMIIETTKPNWISKPTDFGAVGILLDAIQK
jgi:phage tail-like protein